MRAGVKRQQAGSRRNLGSTSSSEKRFFSAPGCGAHWMSVVFIQVKTAGTYSPSSAEAENELCLRSLVCLRGKL